MSRNMGATRKLSRAATREDFTRAKRGAAERAPHVLPEGNETWMIKLWKRSVGNRMPGG